MNRWRLPVAATSFRYEFYTFHIGAHSFHASAIVSVKHNVAVWEVPAKYKRGGLFWRKRKMLWPSFKSFYGYTKVTLASGEEFMVESRRDMQKIAPAGFTDYAVKQQFNAVERKALMGARWQGDAHNEIVMQPVHEFRNAVLEHMKDRA